MAQEGSQSFVDKGVVRPDAELLLDREAIPAGGNSCGNFASQYCLVQSYPDATGWKVNSGRLANETPHVATRMEGRLGSVHDPSTNRWRCVCSGLSRKICPV